MRVEELLETVGSGISGATEEVTSRVTKALVEKEVNSRTEAFLSVLAKLEELRRAEKRIRPDQEQVSMGEDGSLGKSTLFFSKGKAEELRKNREEQKKFEEGLNKAPGGDFYKVKELAGKSKPESGEKKEE